MIALLVAAVECSLAATPAGFRLGPAGTGSYAGVRQVLIVAPGSAGLWHAAPRVRSGYDRVSVDLEALGLATWAEGWSDSGISGFQVGGRVHLGQRRGFALGIESLIPLGGMDAWGSRSREVYGSFLLFGEHALGPAAPAEGGARGLIRWGIGAAGDGAVVEVAGAAEIPLGGALSLVGEAEAVAGPELPAAAARPMLRWRVAEGWAVDAGLQVPLPDVLRVDPHVQVIAQLSADLGGAERADAP